MKKFLDQDFSGAALAEFKREVWISALLCLLFEASIELKKSGVLEHVVVSNTLLIFKRGYDQHSPKKLVLSFSGSV